MNLANVYVVKARIVLQWCLMKIFLVVVVFLILTEVLGITFEF